MKQGVFILLLLCISFLGLAQLDAGDDQIICKGDLVQLNASGGSNYSWTSVPNDPTLSDPTISNPTVQPDTTTMYIVMAREVGNNTIGNSGFEQGNSGFLSDYTYNPVTIWDPGTYAIVADANDVHPNFDCDEDHTTGDGMMMCVNGSGVANVEVWTKTIPFIQPNTEYEFSTWISSLAPENPARLQFSINGELIGQPFQATSTTCQWNQFFEIWESGTSTSATISIVNQNTQMSGNDFSLDDISFAIVNYIYDTVVVHVLDKPTSEFTLGPDICSIDTALITYSGNAPDTSIYHWNFDGGTVISGSGQGPYNIQWDIAGEKKISLWVEHACASDTTTQTLFVHKNPTAHITADALSIPYGTNTSLHGNMTGQPGPMTFTWEPATDLVNPSSLDPVTQLLYANTEFIFEVTDESSQCKSADTILIEISGDALAITSFIATPDTICDGDATELQLFVSGGSGTYSASWTSNPPGFSHVGPEMNIPASPGQTTTYYVIVSDGFTVLPKDSVRIVVSPQTELTYQPMDTLTEPGQTVIFEVDAINETAYQWQVDKDDGSSWIDLSDTSPFSGVATKTLTVSPTTSEMSGWEFRCVVSGLCNPVTSTPAMLTVFTAPTIVNSLEGGEICEKDSLSVPYYVSNFIDIVDFQVVLEYDSDVISFVNIIDVVSELEGLIELKTTGNLLTVSGAFDSPISLSTEKAFSFVFTGENHGTSALEWQTAECYAVNKLNYTTPMEFAGDEIQIEALAKTPNLAYADHDTLSILDEVNIQLAAEGGSGDRLIWSLDTCDGEYVGEGNPLEIFRPEVTTTYFARYETICGMSDCKNVMIVINQEFDVYAPNAFTPNNDGLNDSFSLVSASDLYSYRMQIFNRWGQLIFESSDIFTGWDGTYKGSPAEVGTYVWKATYQFRREGSGSAYSTESGTVNLVR